MRPGGRDVLCVKFYQAIIDHRRPVFFGKPSILRYDIGVQHLIGSIFRLELIGRLRNKAVWQRIFALYIIKHPHFLSPIFQITSHRTPARRTSPESSFSRSPLSSTPPPASGRRSAAPSPLGLRPGPLSARGRRSGSAP